MDLTQSYWPADTTRPILQKSIGTVLEDAASQSPDQLAIAEVVPQGMPSVVGCAATDRTWTYAQLLDDARRCASWLLSNFAFGDRICIWAPNIPEWIVLQYGAALSGITLVTANPALKAGELKYVLEQARVRALFHVEEFRGLDTGAVAREAAGDGVALHAFGGWLATVRSAPLRDLPVVPVEHPAQIQYTSGTTGHPKGALLHHRGLVTNASYVAARTGMSRSVLVSPMPLFHTAGSVMSVLGCATSQSTLVLPLMFEPATVLDAVVRMNADVLFGVPTMLIALVEAQKVAARDLSSLRIALSGGAPVTPELHRRVKDVLGVALLTVYGQTELSPVVCQTETTDPDDMRVNSAGRPLWNVEVRIADPYSLAVVPIGTEGELQTRGYQSMLCYFDAPDATARTITSDGWLRTGDLGTMDSDGYLRITGRLKDMIIRGGENIYPVEVEARLLSHPDVGEVAVFGAPDDRWGEVVAAAIRLVPGSTATSEQLAAYCRQSMAPHKTPAVWLTCTDFPMTASGKIQKFKLQEALENGTLPKLG